MVTEPCEMLVNKIREHNTITMCPYCIEEISATEDAS